MRYHFEWDFDIHIFAFLILLNSYKDLFLIPEIFLILSYLTHEDHIQKEKSKGNPLVLLIPPYGTFCTNHVRDEDRDGS